MGLMKKTAMLLCIALAFNAFTPVAAAESTGNAGVDTVSVDVVMSSNAKSSGYTDDINEIMEIRNIVSENMSHVDATFWEGMEFIGLVDSTLSNNQYRLKSGCGTVSEDDYAYIAQGSKFKYTLVDVSGNKIKGLKKKDIWWKTYFINPEKQDLIVEPTDVTVKNGIIKSTPEAGLYCIAVTFARYKGVTSMSNLMVTKPTKYFGRYVGNKFTRKADAAREYHVGENIDIDNVQTLIGATSENAVLYMMKKEKVTDGGYTESCWAVPETATLYKADGEQSSIISSLKKGGYKIDVKRKKDIEATYDCFGSIVSFKPKKPGRYKVTYIVPDGDNKKFTVKIKVTD